jgi:hypothetical protein
MPSNVLVSAGSQHAAVVVVSHTCSKGLSRCLLGLVVTAQAVVDVISSAADVQLTCSRPCAHCAWCGGSVALVRPHTKGRCLECNSAS